MIKMIMGISNWILSPLMEIFDFPVIPQGIYALLQTVIDYMKTGLSIINIFCPVSFIITCLEIFLAVYMIEHAYFILMWVLKKIPMLGIN